MPPSTNRSQNLFDQESLSRRNQSVLSPDSPPVKVSSAGSQLATAVRPDSEPGARGPRGEQFGPFSPSETRPYSIQKTTSVFTAPLPKATEPNLKRAPLVIKGEMKKTTRLPHRKHYLLVSLLGVCVLFLTLTLTCLSASPLGHVFEWIFFFLQAGSSLVANPGNARNNVLMQATASAIYHRQKDGYDPYYSGGPVATNGGYSLAWPVGECTYWANYEYHRDSGYWVAWSGNAGQWAFGARRAGWVVSQSPHVPSIMVLMPHVQGASAYGHVGVVRNIIGGTTVVTSNMNWYANGGGFNRVSFASFSVGSGVYFVWHP